MKSQQQINVEETPLSNLVNFVSNGDVDSVAKLLAADCDVNQANSDGMTALMFAAANGNKEILCLLLNQGATVDVATEEGVSALALAAFLGHHQVVRELVCRGANVASIGRFRTAVEDCAQTHGFVPLSATPEEGQSNEQRQDSIDIASGTTACNVSSQPSSEGFDWLFSSVVNEPSPASLWSDYDEFNHSKAPAQTPIRFAVIEEACAAGSDESEDNSDENTMACMSCQINDDETDVLEEADMPNEESSIAARSEKNRAVRPLVLDESSVLPNEASYATVGLHQDRPVRPRILDESSVLPNEASYATVALKQDRPVRPRVLDESSVLPNEASYATVPLRQDPHVRRRILDESSVPLNEASFASAALHLERHVRPRVLDETYFAPHESPFAAEALLNQRKPYSPINEMLVKASRGKQLLLAAGLFLSITAAFTLLFLGIATLRNFLSVTNTANSAETHLATDSSAEAAALTNSNDDKVSEVSKVSATPDNASKPSGLVSEIVQESRPETKLTSPDRPAKVVTRKASSAANRPVQAHKERKKESPTQKRTADLAVHRAKTNRTETKSSAAASNQPKARVEAAAPTPKVTGGGDRPRRVSTKKG